ncbi:UNVERIFIED_CONTAM: hypothetical protein Sradi_0906200 [Sesamum radiatum]|uniref:DUF4378 domain-containing protein n=1 Tax=Sesamum radiatum TaxID=300843 RepID=A0AAW2V272_SESRA
METAYGLYAARDNILYAHDMTKESAAKDYYSSEAPIKKLISEEISERPNSKKNAPSVVARLMGVDTLPFESKSAPQLVYMKNESSTGKLMDMERSRKGSAGHGISTSNCSQQLEVGCFGHYTDRYADHNSSYMKLNKPKPREHPQEEELQKFKKEFEALQAARFNECSNVIKFSSAPAQLIAQEDLNREKMIDINEDLWNSTPSTSEERGSIEDFLEEVKERLKSELQGKSSKRSTTVRGGGIETPYWEKPSEPREIARRIAQEVRDSVSRDLGMNLPRSESTRSNRSEIQLNAAGSPEFIDKDTRKFLAERLRNVLRGEIHQEVPMVVHNSSRLSMSDFEKGGAGQSRDTWIDGKTSYPQCFTNELEKQSRSFRREVNVGEIHPKDLSPRNLVRSLSAPVSGTSFGKLLLEDRHILTGAQIRRKHEVIEKVSLNIKKQKKDKFNIKEKVSSFRYSLTLRGRLFRRRVKLVEGSEQNKKNLLKDITSGPTVAMSFCETHENSTEVPPSPASVCSSVHEEYWRAADYLSPISSSGAHQPEDSEMSHVFREINSNLNELRRKLNQLEGGVREETINVQKPAEVEAEIEDEAEAYIRDLLIAAGLYDGSFSRSLSKWDPLGKPISTQVFEEVEETYPKNINDEESCRKDQGEKVNHKMILDLLNEVLPSILREPANMSRYVEKSIGPVQKPPHGRKLLSQAWNVIKVYVHPPVDRSYYALDNMLARDLKSNPWSRLMDDDVNALGRDIECQIIGDMIEEMVKDIYS